MHVFPNAYDFPLEFKLRYFADVQAVLFYRNMTADWDCPAPNKDKKYNKNGPDGI